MRVLREATAPGTGAVAVVVVGEGEGRGVEGMDDSTAVAGASDLGGLMTVPVAGVLVGGALGVGDGDGGGTGALRSAAAKRSMKELLAFPSPLVLPLPLPLLVSPLLFSSLLMRTMERPSGRCISDRRGVSNASDDEVSPRTNNRPADVLMDRFRWV